MSVFTKLATSLNDVDQPVEVKPTKPKLARRPVLVRKTPEEMVDDVLRRYPHTMARLAE